ncbi:MAG: hypothetical protein ACO3QO_01675, partial [Candidatus Kapaibacteriota bacterium]
MSASAEPTDGGVTDPRTEGRHVRSYEIISLTSQDVVGGDTTALRNRLEDVGSSTTLVILDMQSIA